MRLVETVHGIEDEGDRQRPSSRDPNPNYIGDHFHVEEYAGNAAKIKGRFRLAPESTRALQREINSLGSADIESPRPARSPSMQARLARARRDVRRRMKTA